MPWHMDKMHIAILHFKQSVYYLLSLKHTDAPCKGLVTGNINGDYCAKIAMHNCIFIPWKYQ